MTIKGIKKYKTKEITLYEFFDLEPEECPSVIVRPFPPVSQAEIDEFTTGAAIFHADKSTTMNLSAEKKQIIRKKKLAFGVGVEDHDFFDDDTGQKTEWDEKLWKELDKQNPLILKKILKEIDSINEIEEGSTNPTLPQQSGEK